MLYTLLPFLINRMPCVVLKHKSPFEMLFGLIPSVTHLRIFGCACFPLLRPYMQNKLQPKTTICVFLGYAPQYKGYICYHVSTKKLYISRHVAFNENLFPYKDLCTQFTASTSSSTSFTMPSMSSVSPPAMPPLFPSQPRPPVTNTITVTGHNLASPSSSLNSPPISSSSTSPLSTTPASLSMSSIPVATESNIEGKHLTSLTSEEPFDPEKLNVVLHILAMNIHPMQTRSKSGAMTRRACLSAIHQSSAVALPTSEPLSYKSALKSPVWLSTMQNEITALHSQGTWSLVELPPHKNLVGCKWIFKLKKHVDGSIARHKACLVAQGFSQEPDLDYGETFSPVVKPTTV